MFGGYEHRIPMNLLKDCAGTWESINSMKQVERKSLRKVIQDLKEQLIDGKTVSYQWIPTNLMWADASTKEMEMHECMKELLIEGHLELLYDRINKVQCIDGEINMTNIRIRDKDEKNCK